MSSNSSDLWTPPNTENIAVGVFYLILSSFFLIVYAPTITVLSKDEEMMNLPVFKLLMWDSVCDIIQVAGAGLAAGIYSLLNNVSNRPTNLVIGSIINICWLAGIFLDATVALNRFLALTSEYLTTKLFSNRRCYIWLGISFSYAIFFNTVYLVRGGGVIYGLDFYSWYYSDAPDDTSGTNAAIELAIDSVIEPTILILCVGIAYQLIKKRKASSTGALSSKEKYAIYQVFTVSFLLMSNSAVFFILPKITSSKWAIVFGTIIWVVQSGSFPFIVLIFNLNIRKRMLSAITSILNIPNITIVAMCKPKTVITVA